MMLLLRYLWYACATYGILVIIPFILVRLCDMFFYHVAITFLMTFGIFELRTEITL